MLSPKQAQLVATELRKAADEAAVAPIPQRIGGYRIIREIGVGGMGTVYEARQENLDLIVALKVLKHESFSRQTLRLFEHERKILARLHHPGIGQIYEAGMHDDGFGSVPYFAMEYIENALHITKFAAQNNIDLRALLKLFAQVCDAVHHGHQKGIIHRDLKPANILVDESGRPKVIDFGIAKATDADVTLATAQHDVGQLIGTLQYMSPEQACGGISPFRGDASISPSLEGGGKGVGEAHDSDARSADAKSETDIDTRSDVYSLGVILYELICGELPYDLSRTPTLHATRLIQETEPPPPSKICKVFKVRRDLEAIILKTLEKDRAKRYQSAAALADDIRRYLRGEPVEAKPPSRWMRGVKWVGRHPLVATIVLGSMVSMLAVSLAAIVLMRNYGLQPATFVRVSDFNSPELPRAGIVVLNARSGIELDRLGGPGAQVTVHAIVDRPVEFGGGQLALYAVEGTAVDHPTAGQLFATPISDLDKVLWQTHPSHPFVEAPDRSKTSRVEFTVDCLQVSNMFDGPQFPGEEFAIVHRGRNNGESYVCIYDFKFKLHFEARHVGPIYSLRWIESLRILVCAGDCVEDIFEKSPELDEHEYPSVLFALSPFPTGSATNQIEVSSPRQQGSCVLWYRVLTPIEQNRQFAIRMISPDWENPDLIVATVINRTKARAGFAFWLDKAGTVIDRRAADGFSNHELWGTGPILTEFNPTDVAKQIQTNSSELGIPQTISHSPSTAPDPTP